ncbi:hypothetical protein BGZ61DRAFT_500805 [Ilyonectria robusta]|uniref:uncharacterized protein n=1 Tax=Ilyonectria robusta TaxID=1079257 RepID=UPI001E8D63CC|nr:uncharacterized protein BGZ61DRAFT_500805 [Ilyonectria robusta]KAH8652846.1 hypothetical protein BGZ61DRAFT_500805 [Ilyonectria robusta]
MLDCWFVDQGPSPPRIAPNSPPSIRLLERENEHGADASRHDHDQLLLLLPASYRTESGDLAAAGRQVTPCVEKELDLQRLASIHSWLWVAGRLMPPRPLHHQLVLGREIVITERMDMHLVWTTGRMFLKPIPRFLLEPQFWTKYSRGRECGCSSDKDNAQGCTQERGRDIRQHALGFLFSYAALISHESDFRIAKENRLLPPEISWPGWRIFVEQLDTEFICPHIDPRFHHGELRLNRLSKIYCLRQNLLRGCLPHWNRYSDFVHDKFILSGSPPPTDLSPPTNQF